MTVPIRARHAGFGNGAIGRREVNGRSVPYRVVRQLDH